MTKRTVTYGIRKETYCLENMEREAYGIVVYSDCEYSKTATVIASVADLTSDGEKLMKLVEKCNELKLDPIHLYDVLEDFLC